MLTQITTLELRTLVPTLSLGQVGQVCNFCFLVGFFFLFSFFSLPVKVASQVRRMGLAVSKHGDPVVVLSSGEQWVGLGHRSPLGIPATSVCGSFAQTMLKAGQELSCLCPESTA